MLVTVWVHKAKTGAVDTSDLKDRWKGGRASPARVQTDFDETAPPSFFAQPAAQRKDKADFIFYFTCAAR